MGETLRRGIAISAFSLLESFVETRLQETASHINAGLLHFSDLPDALQHRATRGLLDVASSRVKRVDPLNTRDFVEELGKCLSSVNGPVRLSAMTWLWPGSNMGADDFSAILKWHHVGDPWTSVESLALRIGLAAGSPRTDLKSFAAERHRAAHDPGHPISNLRIPWFIEQVVKLAVTFDAFVSISAIALGRGEQDYLTDTAWASGVVGLRHVVERKGLWAEHSDRGRSAYRLHGTLPQAMVGAATRCSVRDLLLVWDVNGELADWTVPHLS